MVWLRRPGRPTRSRLRRGRCRWATWSCCDGGSRGVRYGNRLTPAGSMSAVPTQSILSRPARRPSVLVVWIGVLLATLGIVYAVGRSGFEGQMYVVTVALVSLAAAFVLPKAVRRDGGLSILFVVGALGLHLVGSLLRFYIIQAVYHGVADANGYYGAGKAFA